MNDEIQYMTPGLAKVENIAEKFDAWRNTASEKLVTRVWPIAWWHCYLIPKPPPDVLLADTPRLHDSGVIAALMACGWPFKVAHRVGKATNDVPVRGYSRAMGKAGFGLVHAAKNSGDAYYERYYCPKQTQTTKRNYEN